ncbi:hypothetical protein M153_6460001, partial [Pseudoloma neurophilia]
VYGSFFLTTQIYSEKLTIHPQSIIFLINEKKTPLGLFFVIFFSGFFFVIFEPLKNEYNY